jgi:DNA mismatch repair protein MutS
VARLAGVPDPIIDSAKSVLARIEQENTAELPLSAELGDTKKSKKKKRPRDQGQLELFGTADARIKQMLEKADISNMTPLDALIFLNDLKKQVKN